MTLGYVQAGRTYPILEKTSKNNNKTIQNYKILTQHKNALKTAYKLQNQ